MTAPTFKKATDTDPGDSARYGAPDVKYICDVLDGTHSTDRVQVANIEGAASSSDLTTGLAGKANTSHTHSESDVTNLVSDLAAKEDTANKGAANGYASLNSSTKVPIAQIPTGSTSSTVCIGNDSRLSDARTPTAHAASHGSGQSDAITIAESQVTNLTTDLAAKEATANKGQASGYASLDGSTKVPIAQIPTGSSSSTVCIGNDSRLSDARTPTAHASSHASGGGDPVTLAESQVTNLTSDLAAKEATANKNVASGYAGLDSSGNVQFKNGQSNLQSLGVDTWRTRKPFVAVVHQGVINGAGIPQGTVSGTFQTASLDSDGAFRTLRSAATLNNDAGYSSTGTPVLRRSFNFDITFKFKPVSTAVRRVWVGVFSNSPMGADTNSSLLYVGLRLSTAPANTNYVVMNSDGSSEASPVQVAASDANAHTFRVVADDANSRIGYSFDGAAITWLTSSIPASNTDLQVFCLMRTLEGVAKDMNFYWIDGWSDK